MIQIEEVETRIISIVPTEHQKETQNSILNILKDMGFKVELEFKVPNRGDGKTGYIDVVTTSPYRIAIEIDDRRLRRKSYYKLMNFEGYKYGYLRNPYLETPEMIDNIKILKPHGKDSSFPALGRFHQGQGLQEELR